MSKEGRKMTSRVPVTPETHARLQDFARGLGATFDGAINFLLGKVIDNKESLFAGRELRDEFREKSEEEVEQDE